MTQIVAVSKSATNVLTATDADDFIFHSDYDTLKYETQGTKTVTTNYANYHNSYSCFGTTYYEHYTAGEVSHSLGYVPYFVAYGLNFFTGALADRIIQMPFAFGDACVYFDANAYATSSKLYFTVQLANTNASGTLDTDFSYKIFKNSLGL